LYHSNLVSTIDEANILLSQSADAEIQQLLPWLKKSHKLQS